MDKPIIYTSKYLSATAKTAGVAKEIHSALVDLGIEHRELQIKEKNYWCRDYMPIMISDDGTYAKYKYNPDYLVEYKTYRNTIVNQEDACRGLDLSVPKNLNITFDGGNYVRCGNKVIMTDKIFSENPKESANALLQHLRETLGNDIILLPWNMREFCGHSDGMVAPLDNNRILLNGCWDNKQDQKFHKRLSKILEPHFKEVKVLSFDCTDNKDTWCYLNFLKVPNGILLPCLSEKHDCKSDKEALQKFEEFFPGLKIKPIYALPLIKEGGALHCVTWEYVEKAK